MSDLPKAKYRIGGMRCTCRCHTTPGVMHFSACCSSRYAPKEQPKHGIDSAQSETCHLTACGQQASHKISEVTDDERHPFTAYVCCNHFGIIMGEHALRTCAAAYWGIDIGQGEKVAQRGSQGREGAS